MTKCKAQGLADCMRMSMQTADGWLCEAQCSGLAAPVAWCLPLACGLEDQVRVAPVLPAVTPPGCTKVMLAGLPFLYQACVMQNG